MNYITTEAIKYEIKTEVPHSTANTDSRHVTPESWSRKYVAEYFEVTESKVLKAQDLEKIEGILSIYLKIRNNVKKESIFIMMTSLQDKSQKKKQTAQVLIKSD